MAVLDASFYVTLFDRTSPLRPAAYRWLASAERTGTPLRAPAILVAEVASAIGRSLNDPSLAEDVVRDMIETDVVRIQPVTRTMATQAAAIALRHRIRGCDAIYVALAVETGEPLVTFDQQQGDRGSAVAVIVRPGEPGAE